MTFSDGSLHPIERDLLGELADRDPAISQRDTLAEWERLVEEGGPALERRPSEDDWCALEVLAHLTAVELTNGLRYRAMLTEDCPSLAGYDAAAWSPMLRGAEPVALLALFRALRHSNLDFWAALDEKARARTGVHPDCGVETIELRFRMLAGHDRMHLGQAQRAVAAAARHQ